MQKAIWHCVCEIRSPFLKDFVKWHHALLQSLQHHLAIMVPTQMSPCTAEAQTIPGVDGKLDAYSLNRLVWGQQLILWQKDMRWIFVNFINESLFFSYFDWRDWHWFPRMVRRVVSSTRWATAVPSPGVL